MTDLTPSIYSLSPNPVPADNFSHLVKIYGSNFQSGDTLTFFDTSGTAYNSVSTKLSYVSSSEIDYSLNDASDAGTWKVEVNSPSGTLHSSLLSFSVQTAELAPSIYSLSPNPVPADNLSHLVKIYGSNFQSGDTLTFFDTSGTAYNSVSTKLSYVSSSEIDYSLNDASDAGTWKVEVNSAGGTLHSNVADFTVSGSPSSDTIHQGPGTTTPLAVGSTVPGTIDAEPMSSDVSISLADGTGAMSTRTGTRSPSPRASFTPLMEPRPPSPPA